MKKFVLTGGPSIGKTTVIEILASRGYSVVPEAARMIIEQEKIKGSDVVPWKNLAKFQDYVIEKQLELEQNAQGDVAFLDRGILDGAAYCKIGNIPIPAKIMEEGRGRYDKVFLLEQLGLYIEDGVRSRNLEDAAKIHSAIENVYKEFGYELIHVPVLPPEERVDFILKSIK